MEMYTHTLATHNIIRWLVFAFGIVSLIMAFAEKGSNKPMSVSRFFEMGFVTLVDLQFLFGIMLYVVSPIRQAAFDNLGAAMSHETGYFAFIHPIAMIAALAIMHIGRAKAKREVDIQKREGLIIKFFAISLVLMVVATPWWRPIGRFGGM